MSQPISNERSPYAAIIGGVAGFSAISGIAFAVARLAQTFFNAVLFRKALPSLAMMFRDVALVGTLGAIGAGVTITIGFSLVAFIYGCRHGDWHRGVEFVARPMLETPSS